MFADLLAAQPASHTPGHPHACADAPAVLPVPPLLLQVRHILAELAIPSIRLMTNHPRKMRELGALGIPVSGRIPCQVCECMHGEVDGLRG